MLSEADEIILIDNNSSDDSYKLALVYAARDRRVQAFANIENIGYSPAANQGVLASSGDFVLFLNPDTVVHQGLIESLTSRLALPGVGAVGPLSNEVSGRQFIEHHLPKTFRGASLEIVNYIGSVYQGESEETKLLIGFCLAMRRDILIEEGLLDPNCFLGSDDLEISWRLRQSGYKLLIARDTFVLHRHGTSFNSLPQSERNRHVCRSNLAMKAKLIEHYGSLEGITSDDLWGCPIFDPCWRQITIRHPAMVDALITETGRIKRKPELLELRIL
jgi:GT2 family glycosyltransferase